MRRQRGRLLDFVNVAERLDDQVDRTVVEMKAATVGQATAFALADSSLLGFHAQTRAATDCPHAKLTLRRPSVKETIELKRPDAFHVAARARRSQRVSS